MKYQIERHIPRRGPELFDKFAMDVERRALIAPDPMRPRPTLDILYNSQASDQEGDPLSTHSPPGQSPKNAPLPSHNQRSRSVDEVRRKLNRDPRPQITILAQQSTGGWLNSTKRHWRCQIIHTHDLQGKLVMYTLNNYHHIA